MKMLELLVGMPNVRVLGVETSPDLVRIEIESTIDRVSCARCGAEAELLGTKSDEKVDLPVMGTPSRFIVQRRRWRCPTASCPVTKWLEPDPTDADPASLR